MKLFSGPILTTISVVFLAAETSYIRFFTTVQKYEFHISKIIPTGQLHAHVIDMTNAIYCHGFISQAR